MNPLELALKAWRDGADLRRRRTRYKNYTYGRQWDDDTLDADGHRVSEGDAAARSGFRPHSNNLIRQLVKCVVGNFRSSLAETDPADEVAKLPDEVVSRNSLLELDCRMLEEFLISGCAVQRVVTENRMAGCGVWIDNVSPDSFFVNRFTDPRGLDIELVGMLHSMSLRELLLRFAPAGGRRAEALVAAYASREASSSLCPLGDSVGRQFLTAEPDRCRVIELWTLESRSVLRCVDETSGEFFMAPASALGRIRSEAELRATAGEPALDYRPSTTLRWHCRYLTPLGDLLDEFDSPYAHGGHPFAVKFYPLIDGEVHSLVEDIIDQQRFVNRLITLIDHIMSVSAKGALLMPVDALVPGMSPKDVGRLWAQCDSVIPYRPTKGEFKQMVSAGDSAGAYRLLDLQMQLFQEISGVSGALQGRLTDSARASAALYDSQVRHSTVAILDLMDSFHAFRGMRNRLVAGC